LAKICDEGNPCENSRGADTPAVLSRPRHGMAFLARTEETHPLQLKQQGALLCQMAWTQRGKTRITPTCISRGMTCRRRRMLRLCVFFFACYGCGTPQNDDFAASSFLNGARGLAPHAFWLGCRASVEPPKGGALACSRTSTRAWGYACQLGKVRAATRPV